MICTASHAIEQLILDTVAKLSGKQASVLHWNTRLSEFAL
jgi:hypothetical protein